MADDDVLADKRALDAQEAKLRAQWGIPNPAQRTSTPPPRPDRAPKSGDGSRRL